MKSVVRRALVIGFGWTSGLVLLWIVLASTSGRSDGLGATGLSTLRPAPDEVWMAGLSVLVLFLAVSALCALFLSLHAPRRDRVR